MSTTSENIRTEIYQCTDLCHDIINTIISYTPEAYCDIALSEFELQWIASHSIEKMLFQQKALQFHQLLFKKKSSSILTKEYVLFKQRLDHVEDLIETYNILIKPYSIKPLEIINLNVSLFQSIIKSQLKPIRPVNDMYTDRFDYNDLIEELNPIYISDIKYVRRITDNLIFFDDSYNRYIQLYFSQDNDFRYDDVQGMILPIEYNNDLFLLKICLVNMRRGEQAGLIIHSGFMNGNLPTGEIAVISNYAVLYVRYEEWYPILTDFFIKHMNKNLLSVLYNFGKKNNICLNCCAQKNIDNSVFSFTVATCYDPVTLEEYNV